MRVDAHVAVWVPWPKPLTRCINFKQDLAKSRRALGRFVLFAPCRRAHSLGFFLLSVERKKVEKAFSKVQGVLPCDSIPTYTYTCTRHYLYSLTDTRDIGHTHNDTGVGSASGETVTERGHETRETEAQTGGARNFSQLSSLTGRKSSW